LSGTGDKSHDVSHTVSQSNPALWPIQQQHDAFSTLFTQSRQAIEGIGSSHNATHAESALAQCNPVHFLPQLDGGGGGGGEEPGHSQWPPSGGAHLGHGI